MTEAEIQAWRDIIATNTVTTIAVVKLLARKGICTEAEILESVEETKKELAVRPRPEEPGK